LILAVLGTTEERENIIYLTLDKLLKFDIISQLSA